MAEIVHRFGRRNLDAVCEHPCGRDQRRYLEPAGRCQLPAGRRHPGAARDADRRPRIPLSLHQRSAVGHHDGRRRSRRSSSGPTKATPASFPTRTRRAWCSTPAICSASINSQATTASRAAGAPMSASQATTQFDRGGTVTAVFGQSYQLFGLNSFAVSGCHQYRRRFRPRDAEIGLCRQRELLAEPDLYVQHPRANRPGDAEACSASRPRAAPTSIAGRSA